MNSGAIHKISFSFLWKWCCILIHSGAHSIELHTHICLKSTVKEPFQTNQHDWWYFFPQQNYYLMSRFCRVSVRKASLSAIQNTYSFYSMVGYPNKIYYWTNENTIKHWPQSKIHEVDCLYIMKDFCGYRLQAGVLRVL